MNPIPDQRVLHFVWRYSKVNLMNLFKKTLCVAITSGILWGSCSIGMPTALAQDAAATVGVAVGSLEKLPKENLSLVIHKYANNNPGTAGNGTKLEDVSSLGASLPGAEFKIERVKDVDLTTQVGWLRAEELQKVP
ncbi:surface-anchored fimbrial subunit [Corynebacterium kutscheri]|uniref:Uncharacterized protein n=2 Tax=Corynebacterium kutscheri TaxID=35755 RepID=A0A0F6R0U6_9CORY|nr:hypothetical protein UL82_08850 [Corynebacterium kutscheri]VEH10252.1 surface-anchored fimbrial subunit [Corynebacterium kutscheri]VEH82381.1 surface-anchored fimbrial subunit [Corynebacterium kutscheri]